MADIERIKAASNRLAGDLAAELADPGTPGVSADATPLIKFHGMYQLDDRDEPFGDWTTRIGVAQLRARFDAGRFEHQRQLATPATR